MADVFISYSRKDKEAAHKLAEACKSQELDVWIDWEGIEPTVDWWKEIEKGIEGADNFLFLLSPDSVLSKVCKREIDHAVKNGKRLIPVVVRDIQAEEAPEELRALNWIFLGDREEFESTFGKLIKAVKTDYAWVQSHRRLQVKALEWERSAHENSLLLRGKDLQDAEYQLAINTSKEPHPTDLQREYVLRSRQAADRQRVRNTGIGIAVGIVLIVLAIFGFVQAGLATANAEKEQAASTLAVSNANTAQAASTLAIANAQTAVANEAEAKRQANIALARQLAAQAQPLMTSRDLKQVIGVLLATQSMQLSPSVEAFQALDRNLLAYHVAYMTYGNYSDSFVTAVAFSPDGMYMVSGSASPVGGFGDNTVRIWETVTGKEVARMTHDEGVQAVAFSPDGRYVASAGWDQTVRVWDAFAEKEVVRMSHDTPVYAVAFDPDGKYIVSRGDKTARVWDAVTGKEVAQMSHGHQVNFAAFSPDGRYIVSAGCDELSSDGATCLEGSVRVWEALTGSVRVWEALIGKEVQHRMQDASVAAVVFSTDGDYVVSGSTARLWKVGTGMELARINPNDRVDSVAFSPDGKHRVSWSSDGVAGVWDAITDKVISILVYETVNGETSWIRSSAFSPDGKYVALGGCDRVEGVRCESGGVHVWEIRPNETITRLPHGLSVKSVAFSPDGRYVVSAGCEELELGTLSTCSKGSTRVWDVTTGNEVRRASDDPGVQSAAFSPDGKYIVAIGCETLAEVVCGKGMITVREALSGKEIALMDHNGVVTAVFSPDSKQILSGGYDQTARVWEASTGQEIARLPHDGNVIAVAFSPDGKYVASGDNTGTVVVWDAKDGKEVSRMVHYLGRSVNDIAFSPNSKHIVSGYSGGDDTVRVMEAATGKEISVMNYVDLDLTPEVYTVGFSPDGKYVVSGSCDQPAIEEICLRGSARVWDAETGRQITLIVHEGAVISVAFHPDGKYVLSMDQDTATRVWVAATGQEVARMTHTRGITSVALSPDGKYIVSGSVNGEVTLQQYRAGDLIADACSRVTRNLTGAEWKRYMGDGLPYQAVCPNLPIESDVTPTP